MAQNFPTFAYASPSSSSVSFVDHSAWATDKRKFPGEIGSLVDSAGELLFFVKLIDDPFEVIRFQIKRWVLVSALNPFTKAIELLPRPPSIANLPTLVRVQPFPDQPLDEQALVDFLRYSPYFHYKDQPPLGGYIFSMAGLNHEGKKVMESYYRYPEEAKRCWRSIPCDDWTTQNVSTAGLYPPSIVFREVATGFLVKFDVMRAFARAVPTPHPHIAREHFAKLDDPHMYVFLLRVPEIPLQYYNLQVEWHASRDVYQVKFSSPPILLRYADSHPTYVYGAKSGAIVVEYAPVVEPTKVQFRVHLYDFESGQCYSSNWMIRISKERDFSKALLCQTRVAAFSL